MRSVLAPELNFPLTIRYLATGSTFTDLQCQFRLHKGAVSKFILEVCETLYEALKDKYMEVDKHISLIKWNRCL